NIIQRRPKKIEKQSTPTTVRIRFSSPNPPVPTTSRPPPANDTISFDIDPLFTAKQSEPGTRRSTVTKPHQLDVSGVQKQVSTSGSLEERAIAKEFKPKSAGAVSERIELANVDHWAALVEAEETASSADRQIAKVSEQSPSSTPHSTLAKMSPVSVPTQAVSTPEPERKRRLPVQTRQKQIEEENRRLLAEKEANRRAALEKQRIKEKEERDQQDSVVLGWMREKKMVKSFEQSLPRDREWDRLERERYRLLASTFGISVPLRSHRSQPHTPIPHHSSVASPLPTTPQSFSPTSPMNFTGGDERHADPPSVSTASSAVAHPPPQDRPVHVANQDGVPTTTAVFSPLVSEIKPILPGIAEHPSPLRDSLTDQKEFPVSCTQGVFRSSPPEVSQPDTASCSSGEIKPPTSGNLSPHPPPAVSTTGHSSPGSFAVVKGEVASNQSSPPATSSADGNHLPPKSIVAPLGMTAPLADRTALMASAPVIASEPIQEVDMECDAEEGELSSS
ncbi:hypothetical protein IWQ62_003549, partial [Dispira parvispora]